MARIHLSPLHRDKLLAALDRLPSEVIKADAALVEAIGVIRSIPNAESIICDVCGTDFVRTNGRQTTCSQRCRTRKSRGPYVVTAKSVTAHAEPIPIEPLKELSTTTPSRKGRKRGAAWDRQPEVVEMRMKGFSPADIAQSTGLQKSTIYKLIADPIGGAKNPPKISSSRIESKKRRLAIAP